MLAPNLTATTNSDIRILRSGLDLVTLLEDLRARGAGVRMLAEPSLLTSDTKSVKLLVGDTMPIPVLHDEGGSLLMEQRDLGIQLTLQPTIHPEGIHLTVKPSVSTLSPPSTSMQIAVPAFATRKTEAELNLAPGQSIVIDGLLDERTKTLLRNVPANGLLDAILKNGTQPNTKLVVIVTPEVL